MPGFAALKAETRVAGSSAGLEFFRVDWPRDGAMPSETDAVLASMLATCGDCIKILDLQGRVLFANDAGLRMMEFDDFSLLEGRRWTDFMVGDAAAAADDALARTARGETARFLLEARSAKGNVRYWDVQMTPIRDQQGRPAQIFTIARNATEQRLLEQQKERLLDELKQANETLELRVLERTRELAAANQRLTAEIAEHKRMDVRLQELQTELFHAARLSAVGQMAATLAHELNQPLTATTSSIGAARRLLADDEIDLPTAQEVIAEAAGQARRAGQIIRRLRDFVVRGETEKRFESVATMVEEAGALSLVGADAFGVTTRFGFDPNVSAALVDRIQIQQVLVNLMRNATEAMAGRPERRLDVSTALTSDGMVEIVVADTGPGLPKHVADHLFEPFVSTKRNGMGLGCRSAVPSSRRMAAGCGASPTRPAARSSASPLRRTGWSKRPLPVERVVHVVDDDAGVRRALERLLRAAGFTPILYATALAFLDAPHAASTGCLLLDVRMPGMDGLQLQERLNELGHAIPVVIMTGNGDIQTAVRAMKAGAVDFIEKPFDDDALLAAIEAALAVTAKVDREHASLQAVERLADLSTREREVLDALVAGHPNKVIAGGLGISVRTVEVHRARMLQRLGTRRLADAIRLAVIASLAAAPLRERHPTERH